MARPCSYDEERLRDERRRTLDTIGKERVTVEGADEVGRPGNRSGVRG